MNSLPDVQPFWRTAFLTDCLPDGLPPWRTAFLTDWLSDVQPFWRTAYRTYCLSNSPTFWRTAFLTNSLSDGQPFCHTVSLMDRLSDGQPFSSGQPFCHTVSLTDSLSDIFILMDTLRTYSLSDILFVGQSFCPTASLADSLSDKQPFGYLLFCRKWTFVLRGPKIVDHHFNTTMYEEILRGDSEFQDLGLRHRFLGSHSEFSLYNLSSPTPLTFYIWDWVDVVRQYTILLWVQHTYRRRWTFLKEGPTWNSLDLVSRKVQLGRVHKGVIFWRRMFEWSEVFQRNAHLLCVVWNIFCSALVFVSIFENILSNIWHFYIFSSDMFNFRFAFTAQIWRSDSHFTSYSIENWILWSRNFDSKFWILKNSATAVLVDLFDGYVTLHISLASVKMLQGQAISLVNNGL